MNDQALGGLLLVVLGAGIAVLWYRGYFNDQIGRAVSGLGGSPAVNPIVVKTTSTQSKAAYYGTPEATP